MRILVVEDDELLAQTVADVLTQQHYAVDIALDGEMGWQFAIATSYDLIVLDIILPKLDGISLCRQLRQERYQVPILLLTAKDSYIDKVMGLDAGADDYVIKPVNFDELTARIRALLRRGNTASSPLLTWAALSLDPGSLEATYEGQPLQLTATEHRLLELLLRNPGRVFSRSAIVEHLWTYDEQPEAATVKTYIKNLRQKLKSTGAPADSIETVYGLGYRLKPISSCDENTAREQQMLLAVAQARASFRTKIRDRLAILQQAVEAMEASLLSTELHEQAIHEAHRFAGALGTFGFTVASQQAEAVEDLLQVRSLNSDDVQQIRQLVDQLSQTLEPSLTQTPSNAKNHPAYPHLGVISKDIQWVQALTQSACAQPITVKAAAVGGEWLERMLYWARVEAPDVVLLDLAVVPFPQVMTLLAELSKRLSVPVIVVAEHDNFDHRIEVVRRGGRRFLLKATPADRVLEQALQVLQPFQAKSAKVLVVNGDRSALEKIREILEPWGLQLKLLDDSKQFWQTLIAFSPNLLVLGMELPHFDGIDLCRVVRTDPDWKHLPILSLTSQNDAETVHQLFAAGVDDCIPKPITGRKLLTRVLNRLARAQ